MPFAGAQDDPSSVHEAAASDVQSEGENNNTPVEVEAPLLLNTKDALFPWSSSKDIQHVPHWDYPIYGMTKMWRWIQKYHNMEPNYPAPKENESYALNQWCSSDAEISLRSPRKLFIFIIKKNTYRIKVPEK